MKYAMRENNLAMVGDTHSVYTFHQIVEEYLPECLDVFHVGDLGVGFDPKKDEKQLTRLGELADERGIRLYAIRGNHDDPSMWPNVFGGLTLLEDYSILVFPNEKTAMCVGGGISIDRCVRKEGQSWWSGEQTKVELGKCRLCDFLFLHDSPSYFNKTNKTLKDYKVYDRTKDEVVLVHERDKTLMTESSVQRNKIDQIVRAVKPIRIIGGHYHNSISEHVNNIRYRCLDINEVYDFNANES